MQHSVFQEEWKTDFKKPVTSFDDIPCMFEAGIVSFFWCIARTKLVVMCQIFQIACAINGTFRRTSYAKYGIYLASC